MAWDVHIQNGLDETGQRIQYGITVDGLREPDRVARRVNAFLRAGLIAFGLWLAQHVLPFDIENVPIGKSGEMDGKVAVVTGGGSGLGEAICRGLARRGATVVVGDINAEAAERVADELGQPATAAAFDVADPEAVTQAIDRIVDTHGRIDMLVNNAGIAPDRPEIRERGMANMAARMAGAEVPPLQATSTLSDADWDRMLRIHLYGTFHCTRAALRHMEQQRSGAIVNMASIAGIGGLPSAPEYSAAKGGIISFTKSVAGEVAPVGIRVNAVAPGFIDTPLLADFDDVMRTMLTFRTPLGRLGTADEVANVVCFLLSDEASYSVGEIVTITGGFG